MQGKVKMHLGLDTSLYLPCQGSRPTAWLWHRMQVTAGDGIASCWQWTPQLGNVVHHRPALRAAEPSCCAACVS